jgi:hypothetical protein
MMKNIQLCIFLLTAFNINPAYAEVFKCIATTGKIVYQPTPCAPTSAKQRLLEVETMTDEERAVAKQKLQNWQDQQAAEDAAKAQAERERRLAWERQESLELQRRSVMAQEQQAIEAQRQNQLRQGIGFPGRPCSGVMWGQYEWDRHYRLDDCYAGSRRFYPQTNQPWPPPYHRPRHHSHQPPMLLPSPKPQEKQERRWSGKPIGP